MSAHTTACTHTGDEADKDVSEQYWALPCQPNDRGTCARRQPWLRAVCLQVLGSRSLWLATVRESYVYALVIAAAFPRLEPRPVATALLQWTWTAARSRHNRDSDHSGAVSRSAGPLACLHTTVRRRLHRQSLRKPNHMNTNHAPNTKSSRLNRLCTHARARTFTNPLSMCAHACCLRASRRSDGLNKRQRTQHQELK